MPGGPRQYFAEWLPALFERTLAIDELEAAPKAQLRWIFTGPIGRVHGGGRRRQGAPFRALLRFAWTGQGAPGGCASGTTSGGRWEKSHLSIRGALKAITVVVDHQLRVRIRLNGQETLAQQAVLDVNQHQVAFAGEGGARGRLLPAHRRPRRWRSMKPLRVPGDPGLGRHHHPSGLRQLSARGKRRVVAQTRRVQPAAPS